MNPLPVPEEAKRARPWAEPIDIGPPKDHESIPSLEDCGTLPCLVEHPSGQPWRVRSYWLPTPEELALLNAGGTVELGVVTWPMVPVSVSVWPPTHPLDPEPLRPIVP